MAEDEPKAKALQEKSLGNKAFKAGNPTEALRRYSAAISLTPDDHLLHSNRSMALAKLGRWRESEESAALAVRLSPGFVKGYFRLAKAQLEQGENADALQSCKQGFSAEQKPPALPAPGGERELKEVGERRSHARRDSTETKAVRELEALAATAAKRLEENQAGGGPIVKDTTDTGVALPSAEGKSGRRRSSLTAGKVSHGAGTGSADSGEAPKVSIKDFRVVEELGTGNFSTIVKAEHRRTGKPFALKMIEKAEVNRLKRRHENVFNEIYMEKRALTKLAHPNIVRMHSTFQDYGTLYYLLDMCHGGEIWKRLTVDGKVVGTHPSLARFWLSEVVSAMEHMHHRGLVHRDLKPENMMLTAGGHVKLIDFGTCKDLVDTDLNGGEFVGTAQYMSPQAVASEEQGREADLWALGCCVYQFLVGFTPFHAPSPYLCFLRIKKGTFRCPEVLPEDAMNLVKRLVRRNPASRLGAENPVQSHAIRESKTPPEDIPEARQEQRSRSADGCVAGMGGFGALKAHAFFHGQEFVGDGQPLPPSVTVPKLYELCIRALAHHLVDYAEATPLVREPFPPHVDLSRLERGVRGAEDSDTRRTERRHHGVVVRVRHYLERLGLLQRPKVTRLFHSSAADAKSLRADPIMREYLGLDWDTHGHWSSPFFFVHASDPQLGMIKAGGPTGGSVWEVESERLSALVAIVNRLRPRFLLISGDMTHASPGHEFYEGQITAARQILAKISETIPVLYCPGNHDLGSTEAGRGVEFDYVKRFGADFYSFWWGGLRGLVINTNLWTCANADPERRLAQERWFDQELAVAQLNAHHLIVIGHHPWFLNNPYEEQHPVWTPIPRDTRLKWLAKMGRCKVKFIFAGHCHRNYVARIRRPVVPKQPPLAAAGDDSGRSAAASTSAVAAATATLTTAGSAPDAEEGTIAAKKLSYSKIPALDDAALVRDAQTAQGASNSSLCGDGAASVGIDTKDVGAEKEMHLCLQRQVGDCDRRTAGDADSEADPGALSENEDDEAPEEIDMRSVVTSSCAAPLGKDPPGFRVVRVLSRRIEHKYYSLDDPPAEVSLRDDSD